MKVEYIKKTFGFALAVVLLSGCSDWLESESINETILDGTFKTEEDYAALRAWKQTPGLPQVFVWFDNWTGTSVTGKYSLRGLPDSVTIASNWGGHPKFDLSADRRADMEYVQKVKGTKVVVTLFSARVGDDMPKLDIYDIGNSSDEAVVRPAIRTYAEAIYDAVVASGYDGFDWDYEPTVSGDYTAYLWRNDVQSRTFVEELSWWFGAGSQRTDRDGRKPAKPGLLFIVDGEVGTNKTMGDDWPSYYIDYFILQAYGATTESNLSGRLKGVIKDMKVHIDKGLITAEEVIHRTLFTENFESYANTGGGFLGMSRYIHDEDGFDEQIGGCGLYRSGFDYNQGKGDYNGSPEYFFLRKGITNLYSIFYQRLNAPKEKLQQ